jgi:ubiquinone biosynthesis protein UbiJ
MFKTLLIATLEAALNRYLALDDQRGALLEPLAGKIIAITVRWSPQYSTQTFNDTLYLCPTHDSIQIISEFFGTPDAQLSGSLWALGFMGMSEKPMQSLFSGDVTIEGDTEIGRQFQSLFKKLDIDLQGKLTNLVGENVMKNLSDFFQAGRAWQREALDSFKLNATEFLQEETRDLPAAPEIDHFCAQVDELRLAADRLTARIERLKTD